MECSICFKNRAQFELSCGHTFHKKCIYTWFDINTSCPYCRHVDLDFVTDRMLCFAYAMYNTFMRAPGVMPTAPQQCGAEPTSATPTPVKPYTIKYNKYTLYYRPLVSKAIRNGNLQYLYNQLRKDSLFLNSEQSLKLYRTVVSKLYEGNTKNKWCVVV